MEFQLSNDQVSLLPSQRHIRSWGSHQGGPRSSGHHITFFFSDFIYVFMAVL